MPLQEVVRGMSKPLRPMWLRADEFEGARRRVAYSEHAGRLLRLSVPLIPIIRTAYSDYPYPLFRLSVPLTAMVRTAWSDRQYRVFAVHHRCRSLR